MTALMFAAEYGLVDTVKQLLAYDCSTVIDPKVRAERQPVNVNIVNKDQYSALILAAARGHADVVGLLLKAPNIDVGLKNKYGVNALMSAAKNGHLDCVQLICETKLVNVDDMHIRGSTALMLASREGYLDVVKYLYKVAGATLTAGTGGNRSV